MGLYFIKDSYIHRDYAVQPIDEVNQTDTCQDEVYALAASMPYSLVLDLGCGGGYKTVKWFSDRDYVGVDTPLTVQMLRLKYPGAVWNNTPLDSDRRNWPFYKKWDGLIICADMVEHLQDPTMLMEFLVYADPKCVVLSTPDRATQQAMFQNGPPKNQAHYREWSMSEFREWCESSGMHVDGHIAPAEGMSSQIVVGSFRR